MFLSRWLKSAPRTPHPATRFRPTLESLDGRDLPSGGVLDPSFGGTGLVATQTGAAGTNAYAHDSAVYPPGVPDAGKVVVVGGAYGSGQRLDFGLVRYNPDGSLDTSFGVGGITTSAMSTREDQGMDVALVGNKIYVGGYAAYSPGTSDFVLARFNTNGTLDTTFGKRGSVATDFGNPLDFGTTMVVQPDGRIILAGTSGGLFAAVRYNPGGTLDSSFGNGGKVTVNAGEYLQGGSDRYVDLALSGDRIVLAGASRSTDGNHVHVVQLTAGGQLDTAFGTGGIVRLGVGNNARLAVRADGKLVLAYNSPGTEQDVIVSRLLPNGSTDTGFGSGGSSTLSGAVTGFARSTAVGIDSLGQVVLGGWVPGPSGGTSNGKLFIARFTAGGDLDTTFGVNGWNTTADLANVYANRNAFVSLTLQPDGKALVVGTTSDWKFATARFLTTGPTIASFTASSTTVATGDPVTLTTSGVTAQNPGSTVTRVAFYADANGDGKLDASDTLLGYATQTASGIWTLTLSTAGWAAGSYTLFARATDSLGALSDPLSLTLSVI